MGTPDPEQIGRYKILERVGRGGMGVLLRGVDPVLDREVAIKLMLLDFSEDTDQMRPRFYREARAAAKLQHPNIVTVFEFAEDNNTPYIVMEFLRGSSLQARMASPLPLSLDEKLNVMAQLCSALNYAHEQGVVHRDIKPANIFLLPDGTVKLLDFGVAKLATSTLTRQGDVLGSASYMSPEQVSGSDSVDGRSDIFSTGVVLYELLANRKPFHADTLTATVVKLLHEEPPALDEVAPGLPSALVATVRRALAKQPAARFQTAGDLGRELQRIRQTLQASSHGADSLDETRYASPEQLVELQKKLEQDRAAVTGSGSRAAASPSSAVVAASAGGSKLVLPAIAVAAVAIVVTAFVLGRGSSPDQADTGSSASTSTTSPGGAPGGAPGGTAGVALRVDSDPPGATIALDGVPTNQATPAIISVAGSGPHRLLLSRAGFTSREVELKEEDLRTGAVRYALAPTAAGAASKSAAAETPVNAPASEAPPAEVPVSIASSYPVEVSSGSQVVSRASQSHRLKVPPGTALRITAREVLLSTTVKVPTRGLDYEVPALGGLSVLTRHETCRVRIGDQLMGYPPIAQMRIAPGQYRVELVCPEEYPQKPPGQSVTVSSNQTATVRIF